MRRAIYLLLTNLFLFVSGANADGVLKGRITNDQGEGLSFVSVFVKGTQKGTTCNDEGRYELRLPEGSYEIIFQYIGYVQQVKQVVITPGNVTTLDVVLLPSSYQLGEMSIMATAEDPAYPIMRQVIARRGIYLREAKEYQCKVYIKGMQRLTKVPKRVMLYKVPEEIKPGIFYLSESLSELSFRQPNQIKERMISSKVSGDNRAFSFNQAAALQFTLYDNIVPSYGMNQRGFISPLANNAMMYYKYRLIGESKENGQTIFKIELVPTRKNDPVFRGYIYIVKDSWRLHSTDLLLDKRANIDFVDTVYIKQSYARQPGGVWMPVSQRLIFQLDLFGFRGNGYFVAVASDYKTLSLYPPAFYNHENGMIVKNEGVPQVRKVEKEKPKKWQVLKKAEKQKAGEDSSLFDRKYFTKEILTIDQSANKTDDSIWAQVRPVPLTDEEQSDYHVKDSTQKVHETEPYMDSIDRIDNRPDPLSILVTGYLYSRSFKERYFSVDPTIIMLQYNTVEGVVVNPRLIYERTFKDRREYVLIPHLRYGFASKKWYGQFTGSYKFDPVKQSRWSLGMGYFVEQYNRMEPILPITNSVYTLLLERNYLKEYQKAYVKAGYETEAVNGLFVKGMLEYSQRESLQNQADYTIRNIEDHVFTSNIPVNIETPNTDFTRHRAMVLEIHARITFAQRYASRPDEKINYGSRYPRLNVQYRKGIHLAGSQVDFDELNLWVSDRMNFKIFGTSGYSVKVGTFLNNRSMYFPDYHHFEGNQTLLATPRYNGYQLLDYYFYSTTQSFFEAHYNHHFNGFWFNKIPLLRKLKWQEVASFNYLKTSDSPHYMEWGAGIEHIFKLLRVDYFQSFKDGSFDRQGVRVGIGF